MKLATNRPYTLNPRLNWNLPGHFWKTRFHIIYQPHHSNQKSMGFSFSFARCVTTSRGETKRHLQGLGPSQQPEHSLVEKRLATVAWWLEPVFRSPQTKRVESTKTGREPSGCDQMGKLYPGFGGFSGCLFESFAFGACAKIGKIPNIVPFLLECPFKTNPPKHATLCKHPPRLPHPRTNTHRPSLCSSVNRWMQSLQRGAQS